VTAAPAIKTILFASEYYPPFAPGGAEWTNAAWASALARRGRRVIVVTPNYGAATREERDGITIHRVPFPVRLAPGSGEAGWLAHRNPLFHRYFGRQVERLARREGADLIHAQNKGALIGSVRAARNCRLPIVVTVRDVGLLCPIGACTLFEPWKTFDCTTAQYVNRCVPFFLDHYASGRRGLRRAALRARLRLAWLDQGRLVRALQSVDAVVGVSAGILALFPERLVPTARRRVVHPLPPSGPAPATTEVERVRAQLGIPAGPLVLYAGKRSLGKGTPVLLEALAVIRAAVPGVRFAFAGKGETPLPAAADVHALGPLPQTTLFALYRAADVVVVPSVWPEPLSRVLVEAMWLGRPVVATAVGGSPEAVEDDVTGLLVAKGDAPGLAAAVAALLRDPARRVRMGKAAAARAATLFDEERVMTSLLDAYASVAKRPA
jgi:glycosyltransferase involved in cell wall biosynthesis